MAPNALALLLGNDYMSSQSAEVSGGVKPLEGPLGDVEQVKTWLELLPGKLLQKRVTRKDASGMADEIRRFGDKAAKLEAPFVRFSLRMATASPSWLAAAV
jgi:hypothetical protein